MKPFLSSVLSDGMTTGRTAERLGTHRAISSREKYASMLSRMQNNRAIAEGQKNDEEKE